LGQSLEHLPSPFPCRECLVRSTVHRSLIHGFRCCMKSLRRAPSRLGPAPDLSASASLPGVSALLATSRKRVHLSRRIPCLRYVPSSSFLSSSTVCSALSLAGLFHPAAASRVHPRSGALTPRAAPPGSSPGATPLPLTLDCSPFLADRRPHPSASTSRPSSARGRVARAAGVSCNPTRSPLRVPVSSRISSKAVTSALRRRFRS
jgi:hypothetical protein